MEPYCRRIVDTELDELLTDLPAITLQGPKGVGKTATARQRARTTFDLEDPTQQELYASRSDHALLSHPPVLLDEWQRYPASWDRVRRAVDKGVDPGSFLLTGSSVPQGVPLHSGAGRIVSLRMRPLSLAERGLDVPAVSVEKLFQGEGMTLDATTDVTVEDYVEAIMASGFPGMRSYRGRALRRHLDSYCERIAFCEFPEQGVLLRNPEKLLAWMRSYAAATGTTTSYNALLDAATPGMSDKPTKRTTIQYRDVLSQLWILDPVPAWAPTTNQLAKLGKAPKHFLADPALAVRLLGLDQTDLLEGRVGDPGKQWSRKTLLGRLFEHLVALSLQTYAQAAEAKLSHFRNHAGNQEVDFILERGAGNIVAVEVKVSPTINDEDVRHLKWLKGQLGDAVKDMIVVTTGQHCYRRPDGVAVVPAVLLGP